MGGLRRLEYRGYDSAGVAVVHDGTLTVAKRAGKLGMLAADARRGADRRHHRHGPHPVGHPRRPHRPQRPPARLLRRQGGGRPQRDHRELRPVARRLEADGVELRSDTDTEVVAHLLASAGGGDLGRAMRAVCADLDGAFTLVAVHADAPGVVVGARRNSPLVVGLGDGENFLASDVTAFIAHTRRALELGQDQVVEITADAVTVTGFDGAPAR